MSDEIDAGYSDELPIDHYPMRKAVEAITKLITEAKVTELALLLSDEDRNDDSPMIRYYCQQRIAELQSNQDIDYGGGSRG